MTLGWHPVLEFTPSLVGCVTAAGNHSLDMIRGRGQCVINVPTTALTGSGGGHRQHVRRPQTLHYTGEGVFMVAGKTISRESLFKPGVL